MNEPTRGRSCEEAVREASHDGILAAPRSTEPNGLPWFGFLAVYDRLHHANPRPTIVEKPSLSCGGWVFTRELMVRSASILRQAIPPDSFRTDYYSGNRFNRSAIRVRQSI